MERSFKMFNLQVENKQTLKQVVILVVLQNLTDQLGLQPLLEKTLFLVMLVLVGMTRMNNLVITTKKTEEKS